MEFSLLTNGKELKQLADLEDIILREAMDWARKTYKAIVEQIDDMLAKQRDRALTISRIRKTWYRTKLGTIRIARRYYRHADGTYHFLLDELLGMEKHQHTTAAVRALAVELASQMPFRISTEVLRKTTQIDISFKTVHRLLQRIADNYLKQWDKMMEWCLDTGELPSSKEQKADLLLVEADGTMLSLQREKARKAEVRVGIAYEGWERVGKDRYHTVNKSIYTDMVDSDMFWAGMAVKLSEKYDMAGIDNIVIGGDGAGWIKEGSRYFGSRYQLCRYHLNRELCAVLGHDRESIRLVQQSCDSGNIPSALQFLEQIASKATHERARAVKKLANYIRSNADGLQDYRWAAGINQRQLRRTGAIEGNVDKLLAKRMKRQGMSWSRKGIRSMLCVRSLVLEGRLSEYCYSLSSPCNIPRTLVKRINRVIDKAAQRNYSEYFSSSLPALYGPHSSRPWVAALKSLTEAGI